MKKPTWKTKINQFSEPFYGHGYVVYQLERERQKKQMLWLKQSAFRSFFISVFGRLQEKTSDEANQKSDTKTYAYSYSHLNEKITGQTDGEDRFPKISNVFGKILKPALIEYFHRSQAYHSDEGLSNFTVPIFEKRLALL